MTNRSLKPTRKVRNAGLTGSLITLVVFASAAAGYPLPVEVATALVAVLMTLAAYLTEDR